jgi:hypothetical protein
MEDKSMPANRTLTTLTILDAIAPGRVRFNVLNNPNPTPAKSATMRAIDKAAEELAAKGPVFPDLAKEAPLPGITSYGRIFDQAAYTIAVLARLAARKGGAL